MRSETELAAHVVAWLRSEAWDVYQEVSLGYGMARADIVARRGACIMVVEVKTSLSLTVLDQALGWQGRAHQVCVAVPEHCSGKGARAGVEIAKRLGVGIIAVDYRGECRYLVDPPFTRRIAPRLAKCLCEEQKSFAPAGNAASRYFSRWQQTCARAREFVASHPGCSLGTLFGSIQHHYASESGARSAFSALLSRGAIAGLRMEREGRKLKLYRTVPA